MISRTEIAVAIPLNCWKDAQGNVVLHASREECIVYFGCWSAAGAPADYLCRLAFHHAWAGRGVNTE